MLEGFVIAIDGPVASGKGTVALALSESLRGFHIYTGGTYRAIALFCLENNIDVNNAPKVISVLKDINIDLQEESVYLNGRNVTEDIKKREVANASSPISVIKEVREAMVLFQQKIATREIAKGNIVIAEGRDTGTKVFPNADFKLYLTADPKVRAQRRMEQYAEKQEALDLETVLKEINERDERDMNREIDPLVRFPENNGYFILDNSNQSQELTIKDIMKELKRRGLI